MNDHSMQDAYERHLQAGDRNAPPTPLPLDRLEALVGKEGTEAERLRALDIAMSSAEGRREFELAWAASRSARSVHRTRLNRTWYSAAATLVVALGLGGVWWNSRDAGSTGETLRGSSRTTDSPLQLVTPQGDDVATRDVHFTWRRLGTARNYLLVVVDRTGKEVFASTTIDTAVTLPDSIRLEPGAEYMWWVQAALADGSTVSAVTEKVRVKR